MKKQRRTNHVITGDDAKYMAQALDRQDIPYRKRKNGIAVFMTGNELKEAFEDAQCEREMEETGYRFCIVSLYTICNTSGKCVKIMSSMNTSVCSVMEKDVDAFNEMIENDI